MKYIKQLFLIITYNTEEISNFTNLCFWMDLIVVQFFQPFKFCKCAIAHECTNYLLLLKVWKSTTLLINERERFLRWKEVVVLFVPGSIYRLLCALRYNYELYGPYRHISVSIIAVRYPKNSSFQEINAKTESIYLLCFTL